MDLKQANFDDLWQYHYLNTSAVHAAATIKSLSEWQDPMEHPESIIFDPVGRLLKFYSLLEISLIIKSIPEPTYEDAKWKEIRTNLSHILNRENEEGGYPILLPRFLQGRLEGRLHLEEELPEEREDEAFAAVASFLSIIKRWNFADQEGFLRFIIRSNTNEIEYLSSLLADRHAFTSHLASRSKGRHYEDRLIQGFSCVLDICDDLDRLLDELTLFPLLQSAMWNYHADLFSFSNARLPRELNNLLNQFLAWRIVQEERSIVAEYVNATQQMVNRLASGAYGNSLSDILSNPVGLAPAAV